MTNYRVGRSIDVCCTSGLEPSVILQQDLIFTVPYVDIDTTSNPAAPRWIAFTLVVYDQDGRVYPAEYFDIPPDQQPPGIDGRGQTHFEAFQDLKQKLGQMEIGNIEAA